MPKPTKLDIRISEEDATLFRSAAQGGGQTVSAWVREVCRREALIQQHVVTHTTSHPTPLVDLGPVLESAVDQLVATGLFGANRDAVIHELLRTQLRELALQGWWAQDDS